MSLRAYAYRRRCGGSAGDFHVVKSPASLRAINDVRTVAEGDGAELAHAVLELAADPMS
jgi:hypothetical protein